MPLQLAPLFQDHAVLQRDQMLPVWGWAPPLARVRVTLAGLEAVALSNSHGDFFAHLPALPAGGPHTLVVELPETGERLVISDLLVGEVWIASGQSNMAWTLQSCRPFSDEDIATANFPAIRVFTTGRRTHLGPQRSCEGRWQSATPADAASFTAVGFSFARRLHRELGIPVGIICSAWGGTIIQAWTSRATLAHNPDAADWLHAYESQAWTPQRWAANDQSGAAGRNTPTPRDPGNHGLVAGWHRPDHDEADWTPMRLPSTWQTAGHPYSGVFWFRRTIEIPAAWIGRELRLNLGAADKQDIAYVNGVEIGRTGRDLEDQHWDIRRTYAIPAALVTGARLTVAVRVYSFIYDGGLIGPASAMSLHPADASADAIPLAGPWLSRCEHNLGFITDSLPPGHAEPNSPHILFDNMIQPLAPYALRGAIWYQGESNANNHEIYARLLRDLVEDWRRLWGQPRLAFHVVQLPNYKAAEAHQADSSWARLREAQTSLLGLPDTGVAVTIDLGEAGDIHPKNKIPVGERLAQSALARTYGRDLAPNGPLAETFTFAGASVRIDFINIDGGLATADQAAPATVFLAGEDRVFHPAVARIEGSSLIASSPAVPAPVAVRYAWADNPAGCNLAGRSGLPASPFRSDHW